MTNHFNRSVPQRLGRLMTSTLVKKLITIAGSYSYCDLNTQALREYHRIEAALEARGALTSEVEARARADSVATQHHIL